MKTRIFAATAALAIVGVSLGTATALSYGTTARSSEPAIALVTKMPPAQNVVASVGALTQAQVKPTAAQQALLNELFKPGIAKTVPYDHPICTNAEAAAGDFIATPIPGTNNVGPASCSLPGSNEVVVPTQPENCSYTLPGRSSMSFGQFVDFHCVVSSLAQAQTEAKAFGLTINLSNNAITGPGNRSDVGSCISETQVWPKVPGSLGIHCTVEIPATPATAPTQKGNS